MAFFNKSKTNQSLNSKVDNSAENTSKPNDNQALLEFTTKSKDTLTENFNKDINLENDVDVNVDSNGLKSFTQKGSIANNDSVENVEMVKPEELVSQNLASSAPTENLSYVEYSLDEILQEAIKVNASDVHFTVGYRSVIRVDGTLKTFKSTILTPEVTEKFVRKLIERRTDIKLEDIHEVDLTYAIGERRFRVNIYRQMGVFSIACRVIPERIATPEDLNLPPILKEFTKFPNGIVLVTGPTGSGKSTTIASLLNNINLTQAKHITSIEDPVEYVFPKAVSLIDQREFGIDFASWPKALRSVLRQDPDIVFLGEMRDLESIEAALQIADTGHLVFATLHTNGAAQSIDRIIDVFPADRQSQIRIQLASVLRAVISQRLVALPSKGRMPVNEIMIANAAVKNAIRDKKVFLIDNIIQTSSDEGMISMEKSLTELVKKGLISVNTAKSLSLRPKEIDILLHQ